MPGSIPEQRPLHGHDFPLVLTPPGRDLELQMGRHEFPQGLLALLCLKFELQRGYWLQKAMHPNGYEA